SGLNKEAGLKSRFEPRLAQDGHPSAFHERNFRPPNRQCGSWREARTQSGRSWRNIAARPPIRFRPGKPAQPGRGRQGAGSALRPRRIRTGPGPASASKSKTISRNRRDIPARVARRVDDEDVLATAKQITGCPSQQ
ncbi:unnamed protein product, partial [Amoebophrya sp. A120]